MVILSRVFVVNRSGFLLPLERATGRIIPQPPRNSQGGQFQTVSNCHGFAPMPPTDRGDGSGTGNRRNRGDRFGQDRGGIGSDGDRIGNRPAPLWRFLCRPVRIGAGFRSDRGDGIGATVPTDRATVTPHTRHNRPPWRSLAPFGQITARGQPSRVPVAVPVPSPWQRIGQPADRSGRGSCADGHGFGNRSPPTGRRRQDREPFAATVRRSDRIGKRAPHAPQPPAVAFAPF